MVDLGDSAEKLLEPGLKSKTGPYRISDGDCWPVLVLCLTLPELHLATSW